MRLNALTKNLASPGTLLALIVVLAGAQPAAALLINPASTAASMTGDQTSQSQINAVIDDVIGTPLNDYFLYKQKAGGGEEGLLASSYQTTFSNSATAPSDALIDFVGGRFVEDVSWLLVKTGNYSPAWYLFNLTTLGWNGTDDLVLTGFWPNDGAISHVALYGTASASVPEPAALSLLGVGLAGLLFGRRRRPAPSA